MSLNQHYAGYRMCLPSLLLCSYASTGWMAYRTYSSEGWKAHVAWAAAFMCKYSAAYCPAAEQWWNTARTSTMGTSFGYDWCACITALRMLSRLVSCAEMLVARVLVLSGAQACTV
jgi:hypothetical protein